MSSTAPVEHAVDGRAARQKKPVPSVKQQIVRATAGTLGVVLALGLAGAAYTYGASPAAQLWWRVAGDPDVVLADGVVLDTAAPDAAVPISEAPRKAFGDIVDELAAPLGGGAVIVRSEAELRERAPWYPVDGYISEGIGSGNVAVLPAGVLEWAGPADAVTVRFIGGPSAPSATTDEAKAALTSALAAAWFDAAGSTVDLAVHPRKLDFGTSVQWTADLGVPGCEVCRAATLDLMQFADDGRLVAAVIAIRAVTGTRPIQVVSAAEAFEMVRHRSGDSWAEPVDSPFGQPQLLVGDLSLGASGMTPMWIFTDADRVGVAGAPAELHR